VSQQNKEFKIQYLFIPVTYAGLINSPTPDPDIFKLNGAILGYRSF
jgi:hypothetical protein